MCNEFDFCCDYDEYEDYDDYVSMPLIGDFAPAFTAVTTQGEINFPAEYKGNWVILFSYPAYFTPVCTSEFMTFATMEEQFSKAKCWTCRSTDFTAILPGFEP